VLEPDLALFVDHHQRRHAAHLEQLNLLSVLICDGVIGVSQTDEGDVFLLPVGHKSLLVFRTDSDNFAVTIRELLVVLAQLRHMPAAVRSHETPVENQHYVLAIAIV